MGAGAEAGKAVHAVADSLKAHPLALALVIINLLFVIFAGYALRELAQAVVRKDALLAELAKDCMHTQKDKSDAR